MSNGTRTRINAAFDDELSATPVPAGLRALSIRDAVAAPRRRAVQPQLLVVVATIVVIALVASFVIGSHLLRSTPVPARPSGSTTPPAARESADMVYDASRQQLVLFGGNRIDNHVVNETWTWDGKYWTLHRASPAPSPRHEAAMAYDDARRSVVLYGGIEQLTPPAKGGVGSVMNAVHDTWTWNGSSWKQQHPKHSPMLSFDWPATMAFDSKSNAVLLYGFQKLATGNSTEMQAQTWSWNGSDWKLVSPHSSPTTVGQMAGGYLIAQSPDRVGGRFVNQLWSWSGSNWVLLSPSNDANFAAQSIAYDATGGQMLAFDGDTWTWQGQGWTRQHPAHRPPAAGYLTYFSPLHMFVSFGSLYGDTNNDVWGWNGTDWGLLEAGNVNNPSAAGELGPTTPDAAKAFIKQTMTATTPALFPTWLPAGTEATRTVATTDGFAVVLATDQRDKSISLSTAVASPPPGGPQSSDVWVKFRNALSMKYQVAGAAEYFVYDPASPSSDRWLAWTEPGTTSNNGSTSPGVSYFLFASGLTDQEFWQVANSLG